VCLRACFTRIGCGPTWIYTGSRDLSASGIPKNSGEQINEENRNVKGLHRVNRDRELIRADRAWRSRIKIKRRASDSPGEPVLGNVK